MKGMIKDENKVKTVSFKNGDTLFLFDFGSGPKFGTSPIAPGKTITFRTPDPAAPLTFSGDVPFVDPNPTTNKPLKIENQTGSFSFALVWKEEIIPLFLSVTQTGVDAGEFILGDDGEWRIGLTIKSQVKIPVFMINNLGSIPVEFKVVEIPNLKPVPVLADGVNRFFSRLNPGIYRATFIMENKEGARPQLSTDQVGGTDEADIIIDP